eukprot:3777-Eustigmatos_ZCMA.PRE.1
MCTWACGRQMLQTCSPEELQTRMQQTLTMPAMPGVTALTSEPAVVVGNTVEDVFAQGAPDESAADPDHADHA